MAKTMNERPETDSITALAEFWQTHDLTDFEDALVEGSTGVAPIGRCGAVSADPWLLLGW